jgi:predicted dinucleotide-binding enzyme
LQRRAAAEMRRADFSPYGPPHHRGADALGNRYPRLGILGAMRVTIIGAGNMGRGIGTRAVAGGNEVEIVDRDPAEATKLAEELGATAVEPDGRIGGEVVVVAVWYPGTLAAAEQYAHQLGGKVVVDICNPVDTSSFEGLVTSPDSSAAEDLARAAPEARVVKAFNTTFAGTLAAGEAAGQQLDVFIASDDEDAKRTVSQLVEAGGLRPVDVGPLRRARQLEQMGLLHMKAQDPLGAGFQTALKLHWPGGG